MVGDGKARADLVHLSQDTKGTNHATQPPPRFQTDARRSSKTSETRFLAAVLIVVAVGALLLTGASAEPTTEAEASTHPAVASYASDYGVSLAEAQRRLARISEMQDILAALRAAEPERLAGWGIDHDGPMTAWAWLVGTNPPSSAAAAIAASHTDVEIRTGAKVTFAALRVLAWGEGVEQGPVGFSCVEQDSGAVVVEVGDPERHALDQLGQVVGCFGGTVGHS